MDAQQHQIIQPVVRKYDLIMRNVLKLLSQEAVEIGKVHAIVTNLSNSEKASHK
jgi:predicted amino acid racemase